jgi:hypothetical protein
MAVMAVVVASAVRGGGPVRGLRDHRRVTLLLVRRRRAVREDRESGGQGQADRHDHAAQRAEAAEGDVTGRRLLTPLVRGQGGVHARVIATAVAVEVTPA